MSEVLQRQNYDLIVVDEARTYSLHTTARWKALKKLIKNETRVIGLTGSPRPKSPMDVHGISKLITPDNMPYSRTHWQMTTMNRIAEFTWVEKPESNALCIRALQPGRVVNKRDVLKDLPEKTFSFVPVQLSEQQAAYYVELKKNKLVTIAGAGDIVGVNGAVLINKLAQVAAGAVIDDAGNVQVFECKDRMDTMKRLADESLSGVMILAPYRATVAMIMREMGPLGYRSITGDVGVTERTEILAGINSGEIPGIVCTPGTVSHGVSLQGCSTTIWFSSINSSEIEIQANNRMDRPGQKHPQNIYCLFGSQVERAMYASVKGQQATQQELLSMFNETSNSF
jgi:SNF2 family DNA or RNA helicase